MKQKKKASSIFRMEIFDEKIFYLSFHLFLFFLFLARKFHSSQYNDIKYLKFIRTLDQFGLNRVIVGTNFSSIS